MSNPTPLQRAKTAVDSYLFVVEAPGSIDGKTIKVVSAETAFDLEMRIIGLEERIQNMTDALRANTVFHTPVAKAKLTSFF